MDRYKFTIDTGRHLFRSEIEWEIKKFANYNDLKLPSPFWRWDWDFFFEVIPQYPGLKYLIIFLARPKTADEILGEQIEFQIKQLE